MRHLTGLNNSVWRANVITYLPHAVGGTQTLGLSFFYPGFEQVLEHGWLPPLAHHLHSGAGWVVLGLDVALVEMWIGQSSSFKTLRKQKFKVKKNTESKGTRQKNWISKVKNRTQREDTKEARIFEVRWDTLGKVQETRQRQEERRN